MFHNGSFVLLVFMLYDFTYYYIDTHEILRFPSEIKIDISLSEIQTIISPLHHHTNIVTIINIIEGLTMKNKLL